MSNVNNNNQQKSAINSHLNHLLVRWRGQFLHQQMLLFFPKFLAIVISTAFALVSFNLLSIESAVLIFLSALFIGLFIKRVLTIRSKNYASITLSNLIVHLNDRFSALEDSAQLLLRAEQQLSALEKLQHSKIKRRLDHILKQQAQVNYLELSPQFAKRKFVVANILLAVLLLMLALADSLQLFDKATSWFQPAIKIKPVVERNSQIKRNKPPVNILSQQVIIEPPSYSLLKNQAVMSVSALLDIDALVGSYASWVFYFSEQTMDYYIVFSNGERQQLTQQKNGSYSAKRKLIKSMVYHLAVENTAQPVSEKFAAIKRIQLTADQAPKIRFINPKSTVTEYGKNSTPSLMAQVQISDDFAVTKVEILASIAKGSGEGVKFRDQSFSFERSELLDNKVHYYKNWSLTDLAMEPGDELYFSILATDNRQPEPQQTRSATKIIRWLEEDQTGINADGIMIDFMPAYFKSQRQIIIETIVLIEDKTGLDPSTFTESSELLGVAQSALKQKYGQYLGDEFEGPNNLGVTFDESHSTAEPHRPQIQVHDELSGSSNAVITAADEQLHDNMTSHDHASDSLNNRNNTDVSGRIALINRYGHNHEDSDVGVMTSQDPRALMKKSLSNMWQAELHLMLSEPSLALPFEQQALKLLNLAKTAERIYTKRLGFEPPPVTEQRRYQGEQTDILAKTLQVSRFETEQLSNQDQLAFLKFLQLLNKFSQPVLSVPSFVKPAVFSNVNQLNTEQNHGNINRKLAVDELALINMVKIGIEKLIDKRPAWVQVLVVIERILLEQQLKLTQCDNCLVLLATKLEQLIPNATAAPNGKEQDFYDQQPIIKNYSQFLKDNL